MSGNEAELVCIVLGCLKKYIGILCGSYCGFAHALIQVISKLLIVYLGPIQIFLGRFIFHLPINVILMLLFQKPFVVSRGEWCPLIYKTLAGTVSILATFISLYYVSNVETSVMYVGSQCIVSVFIAKVALKQPVTIFTGGILMLVLCSLLITAKSQFMFDSKTETMNYERLCLGYFCALIGGTCDALDAHASTKLQKLSPMTSTLYSSFSCTYYRRNLFAVTTTIAK